MDEPMDQPAPSTPSAYEAFDTLKDGWGDVGAEIEQAIDTFLKSFDTADSAVRFVFGGYVEWLLAAALFYLKVLALPAGHNQADFDLQSVVESIDGQKESLWSVKSSSTKNSGSVKLKNHLGGSKFTMHPTVFVDPYLGGLVLIDPELHPEIMEHVENEKDAVELKLSIIKEHAEKHPDCFISARLPVKKSRESRPPAGFDQFADIVGGNSLHYPNLGALLASTRSGRAGVVSEIERIVLLKDDGKITQEEYEELFKTLVR